MTNIEIVGIYNVFMLFLYVQNHFCKNGFIKQKTDINYLGPLTTHFSLLLQIKPKHLFYTTPHIKSDIAKQNMDNIGKDHILYLCPHLTVFPFSPASKGVRGMENEMKYL